MHACIKQNMRAHVVSCIRLGAAREHKHVVWVFVLGGSGGTAYMHKLIHHTHTDQAGVCIQIPISEAYPQARDGGGGGGEGCGGSTM